jgi:hypothetical protein
MPRVVLCLAIFLSSTQSNSSSFSVQVEAFSKYNADYIFVYGAHFFPPDKLISEVDAPQKINCLLGELKASGIYKDVRVKFRPSSREGSRWLEVRVTYPQYIKQLAISEISLEGFPEVDQEKFQSQLRKRGVAPGTRFLTYNFFELRDKITEAAGEAYPKELIREEDDRPAWFVIRPAGSRRVKVTLSSTLPKCEPAA